MLSSWIVNNNYYYYYYYYYYAWRVDKQMKVLNVIMMMKE